MDNSVQLPLDIVAEILLKLPVKTILKFKTVCKCWNSTINDTHFTKRHLKLALSVPDCNFLSLCYHATSSNPLLLYTQHPDGTIHAKPFHIPEEHGYRLFRNSCDGLMCFFLVGDRKRIFVWNPCLPTLVKIIPTLPFRGDEIALGYDPTYDDYKIVKLHKECLRYNINSTVRDEIALGYDPTSDDYKIVKVPSECSIEDKSVRVEAFSFKANSWKTMWFPLTTSVRYSITQVLVYAKNRVHWPAREHHEGDKQSLRIMYFDLVGESLELMNLPSPKLFCPKLMNYKDSIAISGLNYNWYPEYWVLEDCCGMKSSWKKTLCMNYDYCKIAPFSGVTLNGECFAHMREGGFRIYDPKDGNLEADIKGNHITHVKECSCSFSPSPYVQSLLLPTQLH